MPILGGRGNPASLWRTEMTNIDMDDDDVEGNGGTDSKGRKRPKVTERTWLKDREGTATKDPREARGVRIEVFGAGENAGIVEVFPEDLSAEVQNAATLFGVNIVLTNTMGGKAGDEAYEAIMARLETLQNGEWSSRKGAEGPRLSLLAEAVVRAKAKQGQERTVEAVTERLRAMTPEDRKALLATPEVQVEYKRIQAERATAAADAAAKAAGQAGGEKSQALDSI